MTRDSRKTSAGRARAKSRPSTPRRRSGAGRTTSVRSATTRTTKPTNARAVRKTRSPRSMRRLAVVGALIVFLAVVIAPTVRSYVSQRQQVSKLQAQVAEQQADVSALKSEKRKWNDPKYIQAQAGKRLGYTKPGETLTIYVTDHKSATEAAQKSKQSQTWYGTLWQSVVTSGEH